MSPNDPKSWLCFKPIAAEQRHLMGTNLNRVQEEDESHYRGVPITHNIPSISNGRAFDGLGYSSTAFLNLSLF